MVKKTLDAMRELSSEAQKHEHKLDVTVQFEHRHSLRCPEGCDGKINVRQMEAIINDEFERILNG